MDLDAFVGLREINAIIFRTIAIQLFPFALDYAKPFESRWSRSSGKIWNSASSSSCNFFGSAGDLRCAQFVKDDLEHAVVIW